MGSLGCSVHGLITKANMVAQTGELNTDGLCMLLNIKQIQKVEESEPGVLVATFKLYVFHNTMGAGY